MVCSLNIVSTDRVNQSLSKLKNFISIGWRFYVCRTAALVRTYLYTLGFDMWQWPWFDSKQCLCKHKPICLLKSGVGDQTIRTGLSYVSINYSQ